MNRRNLFQVLAAMPIIAAIGPAVAAPHRSSQPAWLVIDRRRINPAAQRISFLHRSGIQPVEAMKVMARGHALWLTSVKITYRGGRTQTQTFNISIPPGSTSPAFAFAVRGNLVRRIDISCNALQLAGGSGEIVLWGETATPLTQTVSE